MAKRFPAIFQLGCLLTFGFVASYADEVLLKDGTRLEGIVVMETAEKIVLDQSGQRKVVSRHEIVSVVKSTHPVKPVQPNVAPPTVAPKTTATLEEARPTVPFWPPLENKTYPELVLINQRGEPMKLSSFRGKVILIETVAMSCEGCQQLSGSGTCGGFPNSSAPLTKAKSFEDYFPQYAGGVALSDPRIVFVQLILYDLALKAPSVEALKAWSDHFKLMKRSNVTVLAGTTEMLGPASFAMIPGFHLIDKKFVLRAWYEGDTGKGDLYRGLMPLVPKLLAE